METLFLLENPCSFRPDEDVATLDTDNSNRVTKATI